MGEAPAPRPGPPDPSDPRDPRGLRTHAPLLDAWLSHAERSPHPFTIPGHKQRTDLVGAIVRDDVPLYGGLDEVRLSGRLLEQAQARAARAWGADVCRFSVGGSTHGNQTLALAVGKPGDRVIVQRTLHRSMLLGLVLAGLEPVWVAPELDARWGMPRGLAPDALAAALGSAPDAKAVFVTDPSYVGTVGRLGELADVTHARGIPLVVDAAWAAHFGWHPDLPPHALAQGADALVTSAHKTLPAWSQAALVLARTERLDPARLDAAFEATHTTSPAGAILASTDAAVALLERDGATLLGALIDLVAEARRALAAVEGLVVLEGPHVDPAKLVVLLAGAGADGVLVERGLIAAGLPVEMADRDTVVALVTLADDRTSVDRLVSTLTDLIERHRAEPRSTVPAASWSVVPVQGCSPREAFFATRERLPLRDAVGRTSTELVAPYPPGVPVLAPGEVVTEQVIAALETARAAGVRIAYAADPDLTTLDVVDGPAVAGPGDAGSR
ncbi:MAG TPA: aminotransferase class I/II-fold pyridoxal phosphate-dependent enzyme [Humibacillus xanthopallidus]|nr:aminotransferase class I/II-fold pyridoxal phosphate-dependent enzyme [Humibacillus xanthopallidus]